MLCLYGEPQWGVVGDTFPVGCAYSEEIVFPEYFKANPDSNPLYQTEYGIYEPNCGLEKVHMSFGHDGYIGEVMKNYMPDESLYMLRYHSFYVAQARRVPAPDERERSRHARVGETSSIRMTCTPRATRSRI